MGTGAKSDAFVIRIFSVFCPSKSESVSGTGFSTETESGTEAKFIVPEWGI